MNFFSDITTSRYLWDKKKYIFPIFAKFPNPVENPNFTQKIQNKKYLIIYDQKSDCIESMPWLGQITVFTGRKVNEILSQY